MTPRRTLMAATALLLVITGCAGGDEGVATPAPTPDDEAAGPVVLYDGSDEADAETATETETESDEVEAAPEPETDELELPDLTPDAPTSSFGYDEGSLRVDGVDQEIFEIIVCEHEDGLVIDAANEAREELSYWHGDDGAYELEWVTDDEDFRGSRTGGADLGSGDLTIRDDRLVGEAHVFPGGDETATPTVLEMDLPSTAWYPCGDY